MAEMLLTLASEAQLDSRSRSGPARQNPGRSDHRPGKICKECRAMWGYGSCPRSTPDAPAGRTARLWSPAVTKPELDGLCATPIKQLRKFRLIPIGEKVDRTGVVPKRTQLPARLNKTSDRYAGVILQQQTTMLEQEITNVRKMVAIHQI